ncbi:hypothetical protein BAPKO_6035 (plasmid) [Borreliella afzelii PKo]|nr:hypothetical protein BAPKO_6035 [Borreliella afzelii PKo]
MGCPNSLDITPEFGIYVGLFETNRAPPRASLISSMEPADFTAAIPLVFCLKFSVSFPNH